MANANDPCSCGKVAYKAVHAPSKPRKAQSHMLESMLIDSHIGTLACLPLFLPSSINLSSLQFILKALLRLNNSALNLFFGWQLDLVPLDLLIRLKATKRVAVLSPSS